ncbi:secreted RxLR effector protein 161-like [Cicer arietinum]|uniref:secreted RxLR effector protein 161-like n=1 Tax=Cicer arietinum TaxID=3827 RepID=UPI003CC65F17
MGLTSTLTEAGMVLSKEGIKEMIDPTIFKQIVGSLRYMEKPTTSYNMAAKRILRNIKETIELGLLYPTNTNGDEAELVGFIDAYWCGDKDDRISITGDVSMINNSPISWCSKKQNIVALSTCEAQYVVASMGVCQAIWLAEIMT